MAGKRPGRPLIGETAKRRVVAVRVTDQFRQRIDEAAAANGRSMSQEIESRLEGSFALDQVRRAIRAEFEREREGR